MLGPVCQGGSRWVVLGGSPVPLLRASGVRCWAGGSPPPSPPLLTLALGAGCCSGGLLVSVLPWAPRTPCARWGPPFGSGGPPCGGFPRRSSQVSPPSPSLRAMVARHWVGLPPLPYPSSRPLALSACGRSGGGALRHRLVGCAPHRALAPRSVVPPFRLLGCAVPHVAAHVRLSWSFWGGPLCHCLVGHSHLLSLFPWGVVSPCPIP